MTTTTLQWCTNVMQNFSFWKLWFDQYFFCCQTVQATFHVFVNEKELVSGNNSRSLASVIYIWQQRQISKWTIFALFGIFLEKLDILVHFPFPPLHCLHAIKDISFLYFVFFSHFSLTKHLVLHNSKDRFQEWSIIDGSLHRSCWIIWSIDQCVFEESMFS